MVSSDFKEEGKEKEKKEKEEEKKERIKLSSPTFSS